MKGGNSKMSKKINKKFIKLFNELDNSCCEKLGVKAGGVTEYINRLESARFAPNRDEVLGNLNKYRNLRNILIHEHKAMKKNKVLVKADLKWMKKFKKALKRKKDPISAYLRKARKYARRRKFKKFALVLLVLALIGVAVYAFMPK